MKWLFILLVLCGCSTNQTIDPPPPIPVPTTFECRPNAVDSDVRHCGACDMPCSASDADRCTMGVCMCGFSSPCGNTSDCYFGSCVDTDPEGASCEFDEQCTVNEGCIEGRCSFISCVDEVCDGIDNDCDGNIDNIGASPLSEYCFSGPDIMSVLSPCQRGVRICFEGSWGECVGEIPPIAEAGLLGCDGQDNNCDGCVDGINVDGFCESQSPVAFDVLFLIDTSGSMGNKIGIVTEAVRLFSTRLSTSTLFKWGIVRVPEPISLPGTPDLLQDLTDFATFQMVLETSRLTGGGDEPQWDAVVMSLDGSLGISWRPDSTKILILFTDEEAAGYGHSTIVMSEAEMCEAVETSGAVFIPVVSQPENYDLCAHAVVGLPLRGQAGSLGTCVVSGDCSGFGEMCHESRCITSLVLDMANSLSEVISDPCEV